MNKNDKSTDRKTPEDGNKRKSKSDKNVNKGIEKERISDDSIKDIKNIGPKHWPEELYKNATATKNNTFKNYKPYQSALDLIRKQKEHNDKRLVNIEKRLDRIPEQFSDKFGELKLENENYLKKMSLQVSDWRRDDVKRWDKLQQEFSEKVQDALQKIEPKATQQESTDRSVRQRDKDFAGGEMCVGINCLCPCRHGVYKSERGHGRKKEREPKKPKRRFAMTAGGGGDGDDDDDDDGSSDGSSSENDNRKPRRKPDGDPWEDAIRDEDEERIESFLSKGKTPRYYHLKLALGIFQRKSKVVKEICDHICTCISRETTNIITVVPSYNLERPEDIIFVVYIRTHSQNDICYKDFLLVKRVMNEYSSEGKEIARIEDRDNSAYTENELKMIETSTTKYTDELFRKHSNLQMISPSHFRSSMYEKDNPMTEKNVCIALYVPVKGYIPLAEEALPKTLDGVPTDVREGGFEFFSKANEWHANLKMGCEISGNLGKTGTIGPFIEQNGVLYFLTSAHVLFDPNEIPAASLHHVWNKEEAAGGSSMYVYQPKPIAYPALGVEKSVAVGETNFGFYKKGDDRTPGMEVAVVKITDRDRKPMSGDFPDSDERMEISEEQVDVTSVQKLEYETGDIVENEFIVNNRGFPFAVIKFGAESGNTTSLVKDFYSSVGGNLCDNDGKIALYNQIMISEMHDGVEFAQPGDSGALILANIDGHLRALGLLVGRGSTGRILASPMYAILDELTAKYRLTNRSLMAFTRQTTTQISTDSGTSSVSLPEALDSIHQDISQQVVQHRNELGGELRAEMTTEIGSVKRDIDVLKSEVSREIGGLKSDVNNLDKKVSQEIGLLKSDFSSNMSNMMSLLGTILQKVDKDKSE